MKRTQQQRKAKRSNKRSTGSNGPAPNIVVYNGPISRPGEESGTDTNLATFISDVLVASSAGGTIAPAFIADPGGFLGSGTPASPEWGAYSALYREYRVLGMSVEYHPNAKYTQPSAAGLTFAPLYEVENHNATATALTGYSQASQFPSMRSRSLTENWSRKIRMSSPLEGSFVPTNLSPDVAIGIKWFATGLSVSSNYGRARIAILVQLRSRI